MVELGNFEYVDLLFRLRFLHLTYTIDYLLELIKNKPPIIISK